MRSPTVIWIAWYTSGVFALLALLVSFVTFHPAAQWMGEVLPLVFGSGAILGCGAAVILGRLPATHWVHESKPVRLTLAAVAVTITLLLVAVG